MDKIFNKYSLEGLEIRDKSIAQVICLTPIIVPHTFGRTAKKVMGKTQVNVVERLANKLMRGGTGEKTSGKVIRTHGGMQGKKLRALKIVEQALGTVEAQTKENPLQVLVRALENAAPREDVTRVSHGGVSYQVAVDVSATRRLDMALRNISLAALSPQDWECQLEARNSSPGRIKISRPKFLELRRTGRVIGDYKIDI